MKNLSLQEKEQQIIATLSICSNEISNKNKLKNLYESLDFHNIENHNQIKLADFRFNKYVYLNEVNKYINETDNEILKNLNESFDLDLFRNDLIKNISDLQKNNDFDKLDTIASSILKTKLLANNPIYVYGFNIVNNKNLSNELKDNFNLDVENIISILFDKTNKQIFFVFDNLLIVYELKTNYFGYYKEKLFENINKLNYLRIIKDEINANLIQLFINKNNFNLKFEDNIFLDKKRTKENAEKNKYRENNVFVKS